MDTHSRQAFIGVGSNLGGRWATICGALDAMTGIAGITAVEPSAVYETMPVGVLDQPKYLNLVAGIETVLTPEELLSVLQGLEAAAGRRRTREIRWGPRPLDLDILLFEGEERAGADLTIPHPRMWERAFVLAPLRELLGRIPRFERPVWANVRTRIAELKTSDAGVERWIPQSGKAQS